MYIFFNHIFQALIYNKLLFCYIHFYSNESNTYVEQVYAQSLYGTVVLDGDSWLVYWLDRALRHGLRVERHGYWGTARELSHQDTVVVIHALQSVLTSIGKGMH